MDLNSTRSEENVIIPAMREIPRTRILREEFNKSVQGLISLIKHEKLKGRLLTKDYLRDTNWSPRRTNPDNDSKPRR